MAAMVRTRTRSHSQALRAGSRRQGQPGIEPGRPWQARRGNLAGAKFT
jgi:hypothetical protein